MASFVCSRTLVPPADRAAAAQDAGIRSANDILEVEKPLELLELSCLEEQALIRSLVELRRTVTPPLPLPPGKKYHFYIVHSDATVAEPRNSE